MSDVYVAFVRDDQPFAEALAVALQGSGFTVSRSSSVVDAIGECAAIVVLWTPAAARSKLFVDAADRAFRSGKMVLARMGSDPLPPMFAGTEAHPLSRWTGDPESQDIDSIVFHVDRLVSRARMGAERPVPEQSEPAPSPRGVVHRFPSGGAATARARPAEHQPQPTMARAAPADPLAEEASFWRQIQHSNNAGDFYAYLERFGRGGAFAELAEARISTLGARAAPAPHQPAAYQPQPQPMQPMQPPPMQQPPQYQPQQYQPQPHPQPSFPQHGPGPGPVARGGGFNLQPPPQARPAPRPAAPPPRLDPHPARARVEPPPQAAPRETGGGGGMRGIAFLIFLAVVGGGGFYVWQQFRGPAPEQAVSSTEDWLPSTASTNPADDGAVPETAPATSALPAPSAAPARRDAAPPPRPTQAAPPAEDGPMPQPTLRTIPAATPAPTPQRAPATVGDPEAASALLRDVAPPPLATTSAPAILPATTTPTAPAVRPPSRPRWAQRASARDLADAYPEAAARRSMEGRVVLDCLIGADLAIRCRATSETPGGYGFAAAALRVAQRYRAQPTLEDGRPAAGERATIAINFRPAP